MPDTKSDSTWEDRWHHDLKIAAIGSAALLYGSVTILAACLVLTESRRRWPIFKREIILVILNPILSLIVGCFWPLAVLAMVCDWLCGADMTFCGIECGEVRRRIKMGRRVKSEEVVSQPVANMQMEVPAYSKAGV
jgi:hypothetical protein